jgi:hypothetical protein
MAMTYADVDGSLSTNDNFASPGEKLMRLTITTMRLLPLLYFGAVQLPMPQFICYNHLLLI